ncbi:MAG: putative phage abortive infection protein [Bacteroides sp.]|uniref:putative phage abortive infection protein n=1 Tax=Bacteroides sp. TaxID=29523 RepID=UPI002FCC7B08
MKKWYKENKGLFWLIAGCFIAFDIVLFLTHLLSDKPNEFGDSAGAVNGLFSAFAFAGVIYAIFLQRNELELQREELKQTREELEGQKKEFEQQNETLRRQRFENTFFNMLSLQQEIVKGLAFEYYSTETVGQSEDGTEVKNSIIIPVRGRDIFTHLYDKTRLSITLEGGDIYDCRSLKEAMGEKGTVRMKGSWLNRFSQSNYMGIELNWQFMYSVTDYASYFDHYFRHLYRIVKFVDESPLLAGGFDDKYQYVSMVRAQLSRHELVWLFYNGLSNNGKDKFKPLIEKYSLLKNLRIRLLAAKEHKNLYAPSAFEKTPLTQPD